MIVELPPLRIVMPDLICNEGCGRIKSVARSSASSACCSGASCRFLAFAKNFKAHFLKMSMYKILSRSFGSSRIAVSKSWRHSLFTGNILSIAIDRSPVIYDTACAILNCLAIRESVVKARPLSVARLPRVD